MLGQAGARPRQDLGGRRRAGGPAVGAEDAPRDAEVPDKARRIRQGRLKLDELISHRYRLDQINEAFQAVLDGTETRGIVVFG